MNLLSSVTALLHCKYLGFINNSELCSDRGQALKGQLYQSESESDVAWNRYIVFQVVCLYWVVTKINEDFRFDSNITAP